MAISNSDQSFHATCSVKLKRGTAKWYKTAFKKKLIYICMRDYNCIWNLVFYIQWMDGQCWLIFKDKFCSWLSKDWWIQKKDLMLNFMTCTKLIVGCIKSMVTLYITSWKVHTQKMPMFWTPKSLQFSIRTFKDCLISKSRSLLDFITKISTQKSRFVAPHYQDIQPKTPDLFDFITVELPPESP